MPYPSNDCPDGPDLLDDAPDSYKVTASELRGFIDRIERINETIADHMEDRKEVFAEAKSRGYDPSVIRAIITRRKKDPSAVQEHEAIMQVYLEALGDV